MSSIGRFARDASPKDFPGPPESPGNHEKLRAISPKASLTMGRHLEREECRVVTVAHLSVFRQLSWHLQEKIKTLVSFNVLLNVRREKYSSVVRCFVENVQRPKVPVPSPGAYYMLDNKDGFIEGSGVI
ncbi:hypothetical protein NQ318_001111 [Aromia moschata]|uniref:Uncharacterized protein n=1 Tax=Aromia moschata TaxID=1265417 RepID=A0AAV8ZHF6_9CUCU|nr:hypothetical protein NQ318_001111 [Aromia moschata]